jgi:hypothetical protein
LKAHLVIHSKVDLTRFEKGFVEFSFRNPITQKGVCFETKGTSTKDLLWKQSRDKPEHKTPILEASFPRRMSKYHFGFFSFL